jgi:transposase-like protein
MAKHDEKLKLKVVRRYLAGGIGTVALAREYGVARTLAQQWIAEYELHGPAALRRKRHPLKLRQTTIGNSALLLQCWYQLKPSSLHDSRGGSTRVDRS